jgi:hypothetical protein
MSPVLNKPIFVRKEPTYSGLTIAFLMGSRAPTSRKRFDAHFGAVDNRAVDAVAVIRHWHVIPVAVDRALEGDHQRYAIL